MGRHLSAEFSKPADSYESHPDLNIHHIAPLTDGLIMQAVNCLVFPAGASIGQRGGIESRSLQAQSDSPDFRQFSTRMQNPQNVELISRNTAWNDKWIAVDNQFARTRNSA